MDRQKMATMNFMSQCSKQPENSQKDDATSYDLSQLAEHVLILE